LDSAICDDTLADRNALTVYDRAADVQLLKAIAAANREHERAACDSNRIGRRAHIAPTGDRDAVGNNWQR
jgi:hypothetical protein